jgi:phosphoribosyl-ATP pyrophosphohydrolase
MMTVLQELEQVLAQRREADPETSYVASLHSAGLNKILEKLGEECIETILAAKEVQDENGLEHLVYETADLWFHSMVMLSHLGLDSEQVLAELKRRFDLSGLEEKANRSTLTK